MFERFTERARRVIFFARYEASQLGSGTIETEHLLLGLMREGKGLTSRVFNKNRVSPEGLRRQIEGMAATREQVSTSVEIPLSSATRRVLGYAAQEADRLFHGHIGTEHILLGLLREEGGLAERLLRERGLHLTMLREEIVEQHGDKAGPAKPKEASLLAEFTRDLNEAARRRQLDPLVGRESELSRVIEVLCRRTRNNPVLIGEPGVGKTALVEGLASRIVDAEVPIYLADKRILALDLSLVVAGTKYRGQFEERLKTILRELLECHQVVVFIDELHTLVGAGSAEGSLDAANILKPALSRGELQCIGSTTPAEFRRHIERDRALARRFQAIRVLPPNEQETIEILRGVRERYESFHQVRYEDEALEAAVQQSSRYIPDRCLPDKAIDVLDEAGSRVKLHWASRAAGEPAASVHRLRMVVGRGAAERDSEDEGPEGSSPAVWRQRFEVREPSFRRVTRDDVDQVVSKWTGIPLARIQEEESTRLLRMEEELHRRVVSQDEAIAALARSIRRSRAGLSNPEKPIGSFLFLGPTGVGKTEVARSLAALLFGSERHLVRFDMSEFMEKHSVARLIGSPPGYVGHEEGGQLTERIRSQPYSVVLLDEIEKAQADVFGILLQVFEDGHLTDGLGNRAEFKNCVVIMTSNIGARFIEKRSRLGFSSGKTEDAAAETREMVLGEVRRTFNPEFINRIDEIIVFDALTEDDLRRIVRLQIGRLNERLKQRGVTLRLGEDAVEWILDMTRPERKYGARPLRRIIQRHVEDPLSQLFIDGRIEPSRVIDVSVKAGALHFQ
jgi:ATP-dependent Clp protease ATP-binding subunit ClpC